MAHLLPIYLLSDSVQILSRFNFQETDAVAGYSLLSGSF